MPGPQGAIEDDAACYLDSLDALRLEISVAIGAIASNALERLQESVSKQEALCSRLTISGAGAGLQSPRAEFSPVYGQILESSRKLHEVILDYAALLRHSGASKAHLMSLCRSHLGTFPSPHGADRFRRTSLGEA